MERDIPTNFSTERATRSFGFWFVLCVVLIGLEQISKVLVINATQRWFPNYQFAFSLPVPLWLMYTVYAIILIVMSYYVAGHYRSFSNQARLAWTLIFAGSLSNLGERLALGYVRDFIYIWTGVFNTADFFIILGIILLLYQEYRRR